MIMLMHRFFGKILVNAGLRIDGLGVIFGYERKMKFNVLCKYRALE